MVSCFIFSLCLALSLSLSSFNQQQYSKNVFDSFFLTEIIKTIDAKLKCCCTSTSFNVPATIGVSENTVHLPFDAHHRIRKKKELKIWFGFRYFEQGMHQWFERAHDIEQEQPKHVVISVTTATTTLFKNAYIHTYTIDLKIEIFAAVMLLLFLVVRALICCYTCHSLSFGWSAAAERERAKDWLVHSLTLRFVFACFFVFTRWLCSRSTTRCNVYCCCCLESQRRDELNMHCNLE